MFSVNNVLNIGEIFGCMSLLFIYLIISCSNRLFSFLVGNLSTRQFISISHIFFSDSVVYIVLGPLVIFIWHFFLISFVQMVFVYRFHIFARLVYAYTSQILLVFSILAICSTISL